VRVVKQHVGTSRTRKMKELKAGVREVDEESGEADSMG